jgi:hypothetical protein
MGDDAVICQNCNTPLKSGEMPRLIGGDRIVCPSCYEPMAEAAFRLQQEKPPKELMCLGLPRKTAIGFIIAFSILLLRPHMSFLTILFYSVIVIWCGLSLTQFSRTPRRMIVTALVLMALGILDVVATIVGLVQAIQQFGPRGGTPDRTVLGHEASIALAFLLIGVILSIVGLVLLIMGILRRSKSATRGFPVLKNA